MQMRFKLAREKTIFRKNNICLLKKLRLASSTALQNAKAMDD